MAFNIGQIEKLSGENYATWSVQIKSLLITLDYWSAIDEGCPSEKDAKALWCIADQKALATILLSVKPSELIYIKNCNTAKEAWKILSTMYKTQGPARKVTLFKSLVRFKFDKSEHFSNQLNRFCAIVEELKEISVTLSDDLLCIILLCSLPEDMEGFVVAVETRDTLPTVKQLISKILDEERRQNEKNIQGKETALALASRSSEKNQTQHKNKPHTKKTNAMKCYGCGKRGHMGNSQNFGYSRGLEAHS